MAGAYNAPHPTTAAFSALAAPTGIMRPLALPRLTIHYVPGPGDAAHAVYGQTEAAAVVDTFAGPPAVGVNHPGYALGQIQVELRLRDGRMASRVLDARPGDSRSFKEKWGSIKYVSNFLEGTMGHVETLPPHDWQGRPGHCLIIAAEYGLHLIVHFWADFLEHIERPDREICAELKDLAGRAFLAIVVGGAGGSNAPFSTMCQAAEVGVMTGLASPETILRCLKRALRPGAAFEAIPSLCRLGDWGLNWAQTEAIMTMAETAKNLVDGDTPIISRLALMDVEEKLSALIVSVRHKIRRKSPGPEDGQPIADADRVLRAGGPRM